MANSLDQDLRGKRVLFKPGTIQREFESMSAVVRDGFGANAFTNGRALFVTFEDGEEARMSGYDVLMIVPDDYRGAKA